MKCCISTITIDTSNYINSRSITAVSGSCWVCCVCISNWLKYIWNPFFLEKNILAFSEGDMFYCIFAFKQQSLVWTQIRRRNIAYVRRKVLYFKCKSQKQSLLITKGTGKHQQMPQTGDYLWFQCSKCYYRSWWCHFRHRRLIFHRRSCTNVSGVICANKHSLSQTSLLLQTDTLCLLNDVSPAGAHHTHTHTHTCRWQLTGVAFNSHAHPQLVKSTRVQNEFDFIFKF